MKIKLNPANNLDWKQKMIIGLSMNPESGKGRGAKYRREILRILATYPVQIRIIDADCAENRVAAIRASLLQKEIEALIVVGGDGMVHLAVEAIADSGIPLGIIAVGTGNDIAREFCLPTHDIKSSVQQVMTALFTRKYHHVDLLQISSETGVKHALAIASLGIDAEVNRRANSLEWPKGNARYIRAIILSIRAFRAYGVKISANGCTVSGRMLLLSIANTRYFGGGLNIAPNAKPDDGKLDCVLVAGLSLSTFAYLLGKLFFERHLNDRRVHYFTTKKIQIDPDLSKGAQPPLLMADGEEICNLPATITVLPSVLRLAI